MSPQNYFKEKRRKEKERQRSYKSDKDKKNERRGKKVLKKGRKFMIDEWRNGLSKRKKEWKIVVEGVTQIHGVGGKFNETRRKCFISEMGLIWRQLVNSEPHRDIGRGVDMQGT